MAENAPQQRPKLVVFLRDFVDVDRPIGVVRDRICGDSDWLAALAGAAAAEGDSLLVRIGPSFGHGLGMAIRLRLGECFAHGQGVVVPIRWETATLTALFPVLDGNLELAPLGAGECRLVLEASYRPPLEGVGRWLDSVVLHRVAESTVRSFLRQVAASLTDVPAPSTPVPDVVWAAVNPLFPGTAGRSFM